MSLADEVQEAISGYASNVISYPPYLSETDIALIDRIRQQEKDLAIHKEALEFACLEDFPPTIEHALEVGTNIVNHKAIGETT